MTLFQLVRIALDELYKETVSTYGTDADKQIAARIQYLSETYGELSKDGRAPVDYSDPATRFAYVYKYVAAHGDYVVQLLSRTSDILSRVFPSPVARVTCVGGGPGSDIIAVLKYLEDYEQREKVEKVVCYLLDKEQGWADTWTELDDKLSSKIRLNANFQPLDVRSPDTWKSQRKFLDSDVFTLSYFVSEVFAHDRDGDVTRFWNALFDGAKSGALFLYDDNGSTVFNDYFDEKWTAAGLTLVDGQSNVRWTPRTSERASELEEYRQKFGEHTKLKGQLSYRILRKP